MHLIRGWESRFSPGTTGGLRLSQARRFRAIEEEEGIGDEHEGAIRVARQASVSIGQEGSFGLPVNLHVALPGVDESDMMLEGVMPGETRELTQRLAVNDSQLASPYLLCFSREPETAEAWESLCTALPQRYDTWTVTDDLDALRFEVECGIKRWLMQHSITEHEIHRAQGWVTYSYESVPPALEPGEVLEQAMQIQRWFRKGRKYQYQQEYRLAWSIRSPQMEPFPEVMDIELTKTGLSLFKPWVQPIEF